MIWQLSPHRFCESAPAGDVRSRGSLREFAALIPCPRWPHTLPFVCLLPSVRPMQLALIIRSIGHNDPRCCSLPAQNSAQQTCVHRKDYSAIVAPTPQVIDNADATSAKALRKRKSPSACMLPRQLFDGPWPIFRHHRLTLCISCL